MSVEISGRLVAWLAAHGYLGDSVEYWRERLRKPPARGERMVSSKTPNFLHVNSFDDHAEALLKAIEGVLNADPCRLVANSINPTKRTANRLRALRRTEGYKDAEDNKKEHIRGSSPPSPNTTRT